jgi:hypothetical protein
MFGFMFRPHRAIFKKYILMEPEDGSVRPKHVARHRIYIKSVLRYRRKRKDKTYFMQEVSEI